MPLARDWQPSKGCLRAALRASQSDRNNIPDTLLECNWVKIDLNSFSKDFPEVNKVIIAKVPCFGTSRTHFSLLTRFSFTTIKKS